MTFLHCDLDFKWPLKSSRWTTIQILYQEKWPKKPKTLYTSFWVSCTLRTRCIIASLPLEPSISFLSILPLVLIWHIRGISGMLGSSLSPVTYLHHEFFESIQLEPNTILNDSSAWKKGTRFEKNTIPNHSHQCYSDIVVNFLEKCWTSLFRYW